MRKSLKIAQMCLVMAAAVLAGTTLTGGDREAEKQAAPAQVMAETLSSEKIYMLRDLNGFIAVYVNGELEMVTDIPVALLRGVDQAELEKGIKVNSYEELLKLIEDFGS